MKLAIQISFLAMLAACSNPESFSMESAESQLCSCYSNASGSNFDDRLRPCLLEYVKSHQADISKYYLHEKLSEAESNQAFSQEMIRLLLHSCDSVYFKIQDLNTGRYPLFDRSEKAAEIATLTDSIALNASVPALLHARAELYIQTGQGDSAMADLDSALSLDPGRWESLWAKGYLLEAKNDWEGAIHCYELILEVSDNPNHRLFLELARENKKRKAG